VAVVTVEGEKGTIQFNAMPLPISARWVAQLTLRTISTKPRLPVRSHSLTVEDIAFNKSLKTPVKVVDIDPERKLELQVEITPDDYAWTSRIIAFFL